MTLSINVCFVNGAKKKKDKTYDFLLKEPQKIIETYEMQYEWSDTHDKPHSQTKRSLIWQVLISSPNYLQFWLYMHSCVSANQLPYALFASVAIIQNRKHVQYSTFHN